MSTPRSVAPAASELSAFADDLEYSLALTPRQIPSRYLYDDLGSALFEAICRLPWYGITRTELGLLHTHAADILRAADITDVVELGPGSGQKLAALLAIDAPSRRRSVHLIDISSAALQAAAREVAPYADSVSLHEADYDAGLAEIRCQRVRDRRRRSTLVLCLGSNIGNFDPPDSARFLRHIRASLAPGDALLIGADLIKPASELTLAYDDPLGVTAAFNRNVLVRANRELGATFDVDAFAHRAIWNASASRMEMHLVCTRAHDVTIPGAGVDIEFQPGESIWTESSYKYAPDQVAAMLVEAGFATVRQWIENGFALTLSRAATIDTFVQ